MLAIFFKIDGCCDFPVTRRNKANGATRHAHPSARERAERPANRLTEIMRDTRDVSADTAIRLGRYFRTDPRFWLNLQAAYDLSKVEKAHSYKKIAPRTAA
jgi:plasmid maintenance system antidote protein VapI